MSFSSFLNGWQQAQNDTARSDADFYYQAALKFKNDLKQSEAQCDDLVNRYNGLRLTYEADTAYIAAQRNVAREILKANIDKLPYDNWEEINERMNQAASAAEEEAVTQLKNKGNNVNWEAAIMPSRTA